LSGHAVEHDRDHRGEHELRCRERRSGRAGGEAGEDQAQRGERDHRGERAAARRPELDDVVAHRPDQQRQPDDAIAGDHDGREDGVAGERGGLRSYVFVQTVRHRDYFLPVVPEGSDDNGAEHLEPPSNRTAWTSLGLLLVSLVAVVGLAKAESPAIEDGVTAAGAPLSVVGVAIALLVLLPETLAAINAAARDRLQTSFNLAYGSALASIGLTIPAIAVASIWIDGPLLLGLSGVELVLLAVTAVVGSLTVGLGSAMVLGGVVHLVIFAAFLFVAVIP
jgi:sodium/calcium exchanger protein